MQVHILDAVIKGVLLGLFMAISVGPTLFAIIKYSLLYNYRAGLAFVLGVSVSDILYVTMANVAADWLKMLDTYRTYLAWGGGAILIIAGIFGLVRKVSNAQTDVEIVKISNGKYLKVWTSGFLINTINPGVIISWLTAVTATANTATSYRFTLFGTCLALILSIDFMKVFLADKIKKQLTLENVKRLQKISSLILVVLGIILVATTIMTSSK